MIVVMNRIAVKKEYWDVFEERFRNRLGAVDTFSGFIRNMVLRPATEDNPYFVIMTFWESEEAFRAWTESEAFQQGHKRAREGSMPDMFAGKNVFEMYDVVADTGER